MRQFNSNHDLREVDAWLTARGETPLSKQTYPLIGLIEPGIAVGFLFQAECYWCFLDVFATNPEAKSEERSSAIDQITKELIRQAKMLGFSRIAVLTKEESLAKRAEITHGFTPIEMKFLSLGV